MTVESLYLSPALAEELEAQPAIHRRRQDEQMLLMESSSNGSNNSFVP